MAGVDGSTGLPGRMSTTCARRPGRNRTVTRSPQCAPEILAWDCVSMVSTPRTPSRYSFSLIDPAKVPSYRIGSSGWVSSVDEALGATSVFGLFAFLLVLFLFVVTGVD